jgi:enoyl-CoA hydratase
LNAEDNVWAADTIKIIMRMSPTSLKVTYRQLRIGKTIKEFENIMAMEYRIANCCFSEHDLFEGIRAVVVDKDRTPKWLPSKIEDINDEDINKYFIPIADEPDFYNY